MPRERLPMRKIRDVLRLHAGGLSKRRIAASLTIGRTAVGDYIRRAKRAGLGWPLAEGLADEDLDRLLFPPAPVVYQNAAIVITSQLPLSKWHEIIGEPTFADAILDRIVHNAHRIDLDGPSMRKPMPPHGSQRTARGETWFGYSFVPGDLHPLPSASSPGAPDPSVRDYRTRFLTSQVRSRCFGMSA